MTTNFFDVKTAGDCTAYLDESNVNAITLNGAVTMTKKFKLTMASDTWPYQKTKGYFVPIDSISKLLAQDKDISGFKIYFGERLEMGKTFLELIIIATDKNKDDLLIPTEEADIAAAAGVVIGDTRPCPVNCGKVNVLNIP